MNFKKKLLKNNILALSFLGITVFILLNIFTEFVADQQNESLRKYKEKQGEFFHNNEISKEFFVESVNLLSTSPFEVSNDVINNKEDLIYSNEDINILKYEDELLKEKQEEKRKKFSKIQKDEKQPEDINYSKQDLESLTSLAWAEAEGETDEGISWVVYVVLNRVNSKEFPDTVPSVILQKSKINGKLVYQFSSTIPGGRYYKGYNETCFNIAKSIISKEYKDPTNGALYFNTYPPTSKHNRNLTFIKKIGNHYFYK